MAASVVFAEAAIFGGSRAVHGGTHAIFGGKNAICGSRDRCEPEAKLTARGTTASTPSSQVQPEPSLSAYRPLRKRPVLTYCMLQPARLSTDLLYAATSPYGRARYPQGRPYARAGSYAPAATVVTCDPRLRYRDPQRKKHDTSSLRSVFMAGERADPGGGRFVSQKAYQSMN
eukprot:2368233-Rhodomonas_salina.3